jgi:hypothetical protein
MSRCERHPAGAWFVLALALLGLIAPPAYGQRAVGTGPLTATLTDLEPQIGVLTLGRVKLAPGLVIREIGWDDNVFNQTADPKSDFVATIAPDVSAFTRLRFVQLSAYAGADLNYFQEYEDERSIGNATH